MKNQQEENNVVHRDLQTQIIKQRMALDSLQEMKAEFKMVKLDLAKKAY